MQQLVVVLEARWLVAPLHFLPELSHDFAAGVPADAFVESLLVAIREPYFVVCSFCYDGVFHNSSLGFTINCSVLCFYVFAFVTLMILSFALRRSARHLISLVLIPKKDSHKEIPFAAHQ